MSLKVGIVGLPNVGKSTLFNALLKKRVALSANYPFATIEPNTGVVAVPDERLEKLAELVKNEEHMADLPPIVPAVVEFVDIAGLVKGASQGEGLGNQFLSHIREVDAIVHVLRDFKDENVIRQGAENPESDRQTVETELALADLQTLEKLIYNQEKQSRVAKDPLESQKTDVLNQIKTKLEAGEAIKDFNVADERFGEWFAKLPLLTIKPVVYVLNISEEEYSEKLKTQRSKAKTITQNSKPEESIGSELVICAKLEEELADYSEEERREYLKSMGIEQTGLEKLIVRAYDLLGLISFLTAGKKEVRAWTIQKGMPAPQAAGVIHTDFEKNFIRAQVVEYQKLIEAGSYSLAKQRGLVRTEGKAYEMKDSDVVEFLVSS